MSLFALAHDTVALLLLGLWLGSSLWVYTDARMRFARPDRPAQLLVSALVVPLASPLLYALVRPAESVAERRERELARRLLEQALAPGDRCLACRTPVQDDFRCCPGCGTELRRPCAGCERPLPLHWSACPHCAHKVAKPGLQLVA